MSTDEQTDPGHHAAAYAAERESRHATPPADSPSTLSASDYCQPGKRRVAVLDGPGNARAICPDCGRTLNVRRGPDGYATLSRHKPEAPASKAPAAPPLIPSDGVDVRDESVREAHNRQARLESIAWSEWARKLVEGDAFEGEPWHGDGEVNGDVLRERIVSHLVALYNACLGWQRRTEIAERTAAAHLADTHAARARSDGYRTEVEQTVAELHAALDAAQARALAAEHALAALHDPSGHDPIGNQEPRPAARPLDEAVQRAEDAARTARRELADEEATVLSRYGREWPSDKADDIAAALDERRTVLALCERALRKAVERAARR